MTERTLLESRQSSFSLLPYCISDILPSQVNNLQVICGNRMHVGMIFPCLMCNIEAAFAPAVHRSSMLDFLPDGRWLPCGDWQCNEVFIWVNGLLSLMRYSLTSPADPHGLCFRYGTVQSVSKQVSCHYDVERRCKCAVLNSVLLIICPQNSHQKNIFCSIWLHNCVLFIYFYLFVCLFV